MSDRLYSVAMFTAIMSMIWNTSYAQGDGKTQEIEVADGIDGRNGSVGKPGDQGPRGNGGSTGATGPRGPAGAPGSGTGSPGPTGPSGDQGEPGDQGPAGNNGAAGQDGVDGNHGRDGQDGNAGRDGYDGRDGSRGDTGSGMDAVYSYACRGGWTENGWFWDLSYRVVSYSTGHYWLRLEQSGTSNDREGLMWDSPVSVSTDLFAATWHESAREVQFTHLPSGIGWRKTCEETP